MRLFAALLLLPTLAWGAEPGREGMLFSRLSGDARGVALGSAGAVVAEGQQALAGNPAGGALARDLSFGSTYLAWPGGFKGGSFSVVGGVGEETTLGAGVYLFSMDPITVTTEDVPDGTGDTAGYLGVEAVLLGSQWFGEESAMGVSIRTLFENAGGSNAQALALDVGAVHSFSTSLMAGACLRGVGWVMKNDESRDPFPLLLAAGGRWSPYGVPLRLYAGGEWANAGPASAGAGVELGGFKGLSLRGGGEWREDSPFAFTAGVGGRRDMWNLDYAFSSAGIAGYAHRATLSLRFFGSPPAQSE